MERIELYMSKDGVVFESEAECSKYEDMANSVRFYRVSFIGDKSLCFTIATFDEDVKHNIDYIVEGLSGITKDLDGMKMFDVREEIDENADIEKFKTVWFICKFIKYDLKHIKTYCHKHGFRLVNWSEVEEIYNANKSVALRNLENQLNKRQSLI